MHRELCANFVYCNAATPMLFGGVARCFGKHDRPWPERPIYGRVRTVTAAAGLDRKFDMSRYLRLIETLDGC